MKIKIYKNDELIDEFEIKTYEEYNDFVKNEFPWLELDGYKIECEGTI